MKAMLFELNKRENLRQTLILLLSMISLMFLLGWMLAGKSGVMLAAIVSLTLVIMNPFFASPRILRTLGARNLDPYVYPELYQVVHKISRRAGLAYDPPLYSLPSKLMNSFVMGKEGNAAIVLTDNLLRNLTLREISGIIGHEIAHIHNEDLWVMSVARVTLIMVNVLSTVGQILLLFTLPALFYGELHIALLPLLLLLFFSNNLCLSSIGTFSNSGI